MSKEIDVRFKHRIDTTSNWETSNPVLLENEIGIEILNDGTVSIKIGDGSSHWNQITSSHMYILKPNAGNGGILTYDDAINWKDVLPIGNGGTGAKTAAQSRKNLGFETMPLSEYNALEATQKKGKLFFCWDE